MVSGEKRNNGEQNFMEKITTILLDIEGTTTSVSFVKDTLFPYVKENLESYIETHLDDPEYKEDVLELKEQAKKDEESKVEGFCPIEEGEKEKESLIKNVLWQMSLDRKTTALKKLQGHIWREAYENGKLKGHVYDDVLPALKKWREESRRVYIFSSGSVDAQKLLFGHSVEGNLLEYISGHFDTTVGPKNESISYSNIMKSLECDADQALFLTDTITEAEAALTAGMRTALVLRENTVPLTDDAKKEYTCITSFTELICDNAAKRKKMCDSYNQEENSDKEPAKDSDPEMPDTSNKSEINGDEQMEIDVGNESKPECVELNQKTTDKSDKTDDEKTETDDVEIDVVNEDKREYTKEIPSADRGDSSDVEAQNSASIEINMDESTKELVEPQMDITDPAPVSDPLAISPEQKDEISEEYGELNGNTNGKDNPEGENQSALHENQANIKDPEEKSEVVPVEEKEAEEVNQKTTLSDGVEMNGHSDESEKNGVEEEKVGMNKIVPDDKREPAVEVNA